MSKYHSKPEHVIYVCTGDKCKKRGGKEISKLFREMLKENHLKHKVEVIKTDCTDRCKQAPIVCFQPQNSWHLEVNLHEAQNLFLRELSENS